ncbi:MAG: TRAP transporter TatT component family protein [Halioglobus sp.]
MNPTAIFARTTLFIWFALTLGGCGSLIKSQTDSLSDAILNSEDTLTIQQGSPTFLILADGLISKSPDSEGMLLSGAKLYGAYGSMFAQTPTQKKLMADKALDYAIRGVCAHDDTFCDLRTLHIREFEARIDEFDDEDEVAMFYTLATNWLGWIQTNSADWNAIAELPRPRIILEHILSIDESYDGGSAHLYAGAMDSLLPAAMGGKPEKARQHFERAIELSEGKNLMAKVVYAQTYAKLMFDQELYHRLLTEVIQADNKVPGLVLANTIAQEQALDLLAEEADYF